MAEIDYNALAQKYGAIAQAPEPEMQQLPTGEAYLNLLPPTSRNLIRKFAAGQLAITPRTAMTESGQKMIASVAQFDPSFDAVDYGKRYQTATAFSKGKQADAVRGANQTLYHMGTLYKNIDELNNIDTPVLQLLNKPINYIAENAFGDSRQNKLRQTTQAVSSELRRVFAGAGGGSLTELEEWKKSLPLNATEEQQQEYLRNGVELLRGGIEALNQQYQAGMGQSRNVSDLLSPSSRKVYDALSQGKPPPAPELPKKGAAIKSTMPTGFPALTQKAWDNMTEDQKALFK
jgi:hypothetical protein